MLCRCIECNHQISSDAWRCPNCGSKDAGSRAEEAYSEHQRLLIEIEREREKDRADPGWRQREEKAARIRQEEWERGAPARAERARKEARIAAGIAAVRNAFYFGFGSAGLGAVVGAVLGFGKGCSRYDVGGGVEDINRYGHINFFEPFWYIPETALTLCITGAIVGIIIGAIIGAIKGQKERK